MANNTKIIFRTDCPNGEGGKGYTCLPQVFQENKILGSIDDIILNNVVGAVGDFLYKDTTPLTSKTFSLFPVGVSEASDTLSGPLEIVAEAIYLRFIFIFVGSACLLTFAYSWMNIKRVEKKRSRRYKIPENAALNVPMVGGVGAGLCGKRCCCAKKQKKVAATREAVVAAQTASPYAQKPLTPIVPAAAGAVQQVPGPMLYNTGNQAVSQNDLIAEQKFDSSRYYGAASRQ